LIELQFSKWNPYYWIIEPKRLPQITAYNLDLLSKDIFYKHGVNVSSDEYLQAYKQTSIFQANNLTLCA